MHWVSSKKIFRKFCVYCKNKEQNWRGVRKDISILNFLRKHHRKLGYFCRCHVEGPNLLRVFDILSEASTADLLLFRHSREETRECFWACDCAAWVIFFKRRLDAQSAVKNTRTKLRSFDCLEWNFVVEFRHFHN